MRKITEQKTTLLSRPSYLFSAERQTDRLLKKLFGGRELCLPKLVINQFYCPICVVGTLESRMVPVFIMHIKGKGKKEGLAAVPNVKPSPLI